MANSSKLVSFYHFFIFLWDLRNEGENEKFRVNVALLSHSTVLSVTLTNF